jgi:hypothetical protein
MDVRSSDAPILRGYHTQGGTGDSGSAIHGTFFPRVAGCA